MDQVPHRGWLQAHVNDFCAQTGQKDVVLETLLDLLYDLDQDKTDQILSSGINPDSVLTPGPTDLPR